MSQIQDTKTASGQEIEESKPQDNQNESKVGFDADDIHQAALADNPPKPERPSWATLLSIVVRTLPRGNGYTQLTNSQSFWDCQPLHQSHVASSLLCQFCLTSEPISMTFRT